MDSLAALSDELDAETGGAAKRRKHPLVQSTMTDIHMSLAIR